jgi:lipopolysaccharide transport system permease protein
LFLLRLPCKPALLALWLDRIQATLSRTFDGPSLQPIPLIRGVFPHGEFFHHQIAKIIQLKIQVSHVSRQGESHVINLKTRIQPSRGRVRLNFGELWTYRELLYFLVWRDINIRYKQTIFGIAWAVIQPVFTMLVFWIFLGQLARVPSDNVPYPLFAYTGLVPWVFFANGLTSASNSLVSSANLLTKIYFPRLLIPLAVVLSGIIDLVLSFAVLVIMIFAAGYTPTINIIFLPCFVLLALGVGLGAGFWLSALNIQFRDVRYLVPFLVQFWLFATPIAYPSSLIDDPRLLALYSVNPMVSVVEGFRWALLGLKAVSVPNLLISTGVVAVLLLSGMYYFKRMERTFADMV